MQTSLINLDASEKGATGCQIGGKMELCYDGALVMPNNCVAIASDEMEYIDAGWSWSMTKKNVKGIIKKVLL